MDISEAYTENKKVKYGFFFPLPRNKQSTSVVFGVQEMPNLIFLFLEMTVCVVINDTVFCVLLCVVIYDNVFV